MEAYIAASEALLQQSIQSTIPYVPNGMSLQGMDCQGLCEYLLMQCGFTSKQIGLAGSNAHWRKSCKWTGSPEEFVQQFGCAVPAGVWMFIWSEGHNEKYNDDNGDASHMGVYMGGSSTLNASLSHECVYSSTKFSGKKSVPNGGWNRVGLCKWIQYSANIEAKINGNISTEVGNTETQTQVAAQYAYITTTNGDPANFRTKTNVKAALVAKCPSIAVGEKVEINNAQGEWSNITYNGYDGWVLSKFLNSTVVETGSESAAPLIPDETTIDGVDASILVMVKQVKELITSIETLLSTKG